MISIILNDAPYGTERSYNGLRLALSMSKSDEDVQVFFMGDAAMRFLGSFPPANSPILK